MRRAWSEHPRVVVAQVVGLIVLVAVCIFIGMALKVDPQPKTPVAVQDRVSRLEREVRQNRNATAELERAKGAQQVRARQLRGLNRRLRLAAARERRLRLALRRARR